MPEERPKTVQSMLRMRNGMSQENRAQVVALLNVQLADHYIVLTKTKFYHWNVEGPEFHDVHELLDEQYEILADVVDDVAEQTLKLGGQAAGTLAWFKAKTRLGEDEGDSIPDTRAMIEHLLQDHEAILETLHADIKRCDQQYDDAVTSNLLQDVSEKHSKMAWMLRMILQRSTLE